MKNPQVEVARQTRRIKKDYTNLNLSSKYSENHISPPVKKRKVCPSRNKHKESDQASIQQRQLKENVLKRCLDLGEPIPEQVLAFLNKQDKTPTFSKMNIAFPSQDAYSTSIISARRAIDFQEEAVKALVGAKENQSLFDFMAKQRRGKQTEKEEQQDLSNKLQKEQTKQMQISQNIMIEQLKQNLQYKINPQFIKSELKKEMMQKEAIKNQLKTHNNQNENEVNEGNQEYQIQGEVLPHEKIVLQVDNQDCFSAARKFYPKNSSSTMRRSRLNTAPSTPNEPNLSPVRAPVRQYSVQIQNFGPYYYPLGSDGQARQFEDIRGEVGEDVLCNQGDLQEQYGYNPGLNNSYHPYGTQWNKENCERTRIMIEDQCVREENDHLIEYLQIEQQQAERQEPNYDYQNPVDMSFLSSFCYSNSQHPQAQAEDMLEAIDQQPETEQEYFCHYQQNHHIEASPLRLFPRQMLDEQDHFGSNNHNNFN